MLGELLLGVGVAGAPGGGGRRRSRRRGRVALGRLVLREVGVGGEAGIVVVEILDIWVIMVN